MDTQSKENMQNTIKNLEDKIQNIEKLLEKGSDCLILQYGSHSIKYNRANEIAPQKILNLIAYKRNFPINQEEPQVSQDYLEQFDQQLLLLENKLKQQGAFKNDAKIYKGKPRGKIEIDIRNIDKTPLQRDLTLCPFASEIQNNNILFEDEIFYVENHPNFIVRQPIKYGFLNGDEAIADLYRLTLYITSCKLGISMQNLQKMSCILIIPDVFQRQQIKMLVDMLFRQCGFKNVYIHLESVLAQFAANFTQGCIVDIGHEKINICCVDEGIIIPGTFIRKNFGSKDIDIAIIRLLQRKQTLKKGFRLDIRNFSDLHSISKLKETVSQMIPKEDKVNHVYEMITVRDAHEEHYNVPYSDTICVASHIFFEPDVLNALKRDADPKFDFTSRVFEMYYDPEDNMEELSGGVQLSWCWGSKEKEIQFWSQPEIHEQLHPAFMQPLDQMVCASISNVYDQEQRVKISQNIFLIGGGSHLGDLAEVLESRLLARVAELDLNEIERFEVKVLVREEIRPQCLSWTGASVLPKTESMGEMWISRQKWIGELEPQQIELEEAQDIEDQEKKAQQLAQKKEKDREKSNEWGLKHLKEKIPFVW